METINRITTFVIETCCNCNIQFAIPQDLRKKRLNDHKSFYCPMGHGQYFYGKSKAEILREKNERLEARATHLKSQLNETRREVRSTRRSRDAYKGHLNKTKKRIQHGVCPCCNRTFTKSRMARHIETKHPDYSSENNNV